ncbi:MAG: dTMP kinase [Elusimicrobia bacterium]|nr:dTMP kinase [Elusimicrobiota bacterium]
MNNKSFFITFEGPEGAGKSTQAGVVMEHLKSQGMDVVKTREPGGVSISEQLREILLNPSSTISPRTELLLYAAGRAQHTSELIMPALKAGKSVLCERYTHASLAYQGYGRQLDKDLVNMLNEVATMGLKPDLTIMFNISAEEGLGRVASSDRTFDRLESENIEFHRRVREGYLALAAKDPNVELVDATLPEKELSKEIIKILKRRNIC